jgi:hypothetical protein
MPRTEQDRALHLRRSGAMRKNQKLFMLRTDVVETVRGNYGVATNRKGEQYAILYDRGTFGITRQKIASDWYERRRDFRPFDWVSMKHCDKPRAIHDL